MKSRVARTRTNWDIHGRLPDELGHDELGHEELGHDELGRRDTPQAALTTRFSTTQSDIEARDGHAGEAMKLELVKFKCANCANAVEVLEIGSNTYGEFLLRSPSGAVVYLDALQDKTYEEVDRLLAAHGKTRDLSALARAKVLQRVYGEIACDRDADGNPFTLGAQPACPVCSSQQMASWEFKEPPELVDITVQSVTHEGWSSLSDCEKLQLLERSLQRVRFLDTCGVSWTSKI